MYLMLPIIRPPKCRLNVSYALFGGREDVAEIAECVGIFHLAKDIFLSECDLP